MEPKMDSNKEKMDTWLEEMNTRWKETSAYEATEAYLEKAKLVSEQTKAGLEEAAVYIFEETLNKMDTTEYGDQPRKVWRRSGVAGRP
jgi:hypothetical protein